MAKNQSCAKCSVELNDSNAYKKKGKRDGSNRYKSYCKLCFREYAILDHMGLDSVVDYYIMQERKLEDKLKKVRSRLKELSDDAQRR